MLGGDLQSELLQVQVCVHVSIHSFPNDVCPFQAIFLRPLAVIFILRLLRFLLIPLA